WLTDALSFCGVTGGTYPCLRPRKRIDYIFCSSHFRILEASVVSVEDCPSDHLPVKCLLDWSKDEAGSGIMVRTGVRNGMEGEDPEAVSPDDFVFHGREHHCPLVRLLQGM